MLSLNWKKRKKIRRKRNIQSINCKYVNMPDKIRINNLRLRSFKNEIMLIKV